MTTSPSSLAVLVTYYNEGPLLTRCLESLRRQTVPVDEILVYDDASGIVPAPFVPEGMSVRIIRGESNVGPATGRNLLLREATADLVHFHDSDDTFEPSWSQRVRREFATGDLDAFFSEVAFVYADGRRRDQIVGLQRVADGEDLVTFCIRGAMLVPTGTYRREVVLGIGGYRTTLWQSEDWEFHIRLALSGVRYRVSTDPLVIAFRRDSGRSENAEEVLDSTLQAVRALAETVPVRYRDDLSEVAGRAAARLYRLGARAKARDAFQLAYRLGRPAFVGERPFYRVLARTAGPLSAEWLGRLYRSAKRVALRRHTSAHP